MANPFEGTGAHQETASQETGENLQLLERKEKELSRLTQEIDALQKKRDELSGEIGNLKEKIGTSKGESAGEELAEELRQQGRNLEIGSEVAAANPLYPGRKDKATIKGFEKVDGAIYVQVEFPHGGRGGIPMSTKIPLSDIESEGGK